MGLEMVHGHSVRMLVPGGIEVPQKVQNVRDFIDLQ